MPSFYESPVQTDQTWWMQPGERFALEGLLTQLRPRLAVEVGTYHGGSLRRLAEHCEEVHTIDVDPVAREHADMENVTVHIGDSATVLPELLGRFHGEGRDVDFVLIDGAHTYDAVRADALAVLASEACRHTVVVFHDSAHEQVRGALDGLDLPGHAKVAWCQLDFVPGYLVAEGEQSGEGYNGLAVVLLDANLGAERAWTPPFVAVPELHHAHRAARQERPGLVDRLRRVSR